jgi:uncharacterized delta-60 repeat protein
MFLAALLLGGLCLATVAFGADQTDTTFGVNGIALIPQPEKAARAEAGIFDLANTPEGKFVAVLAGEARKGYFGAVRLNEDGSLDTSFGEGGFTADYEVPFLGESQLRRPGDNTYTQKTQAQGVAVQRDGKVVVVGNLETESFHESPEDVSEERGYEPVLARYTTAGILDPTFGTGGVLGPRTENDAIEDFVFHAVAIAPNGRIIAVGAGNENPYGFDREGFVVAFKPNGEFDQSFGGGFYLGAVNLFRDRDPHRNPTSTTLTAVKVLPSGKLLIGGYLHGRLLLARLRANGKLDKSFGGGDGKATLRIGKPFECCGEWASLALQKDGKILLAGEVKGPRRHHLALARFLPSGKLDQSFGKGGVLSSRPTYRLSFPRDVGVQGDGKIVVVGYADAPSREGVKGLALRALRFLPSGKLDQSFGSRGLLVLSLGPDNSAKAALTEPDGKVVIGGSTLRVDREHFETELLFSRYLSGPSR